MTKQYGLLGYNSTEGEWIRSYLQQKPEATVTELAEVFRKQINPEGDQAIAERIIRVYIGLSPQESIDDLVPDDMKKDW